MAKKYSTAPIGDGLASVCLRCGCLVQYHGEDIHDEWHRKNDGPQRVIVDKDGVPETVGSGLKVVVE